MIFDDKTFYKINDKYNLAIPHDLNESKKISIVDKVEQSLIKINIECPIDDNETNINHNISFEDNVQNNNNNDDIGYLTINNNKYKEQINNPPFIYDTSKKNNNTF